jgi:hypothetical protein
VAGAWLDFWGILWNVPRLAGESDPDYRRRFLYELTLPRTTAGGIARLIELSEGYRGTVVDAPTAGHFEVTLEVPTNVDVESEFDRISALINRYKAAGTTYTLYMRGLVVLSLPAEDIRASYLALPDQYARRDAIAGNAMRDHIVLLYGLSQYIHAQLRRQWYYVSLINWRTHHVQHIPIGSYQIGDHSMWTYDFNWQSYEVDHLGPPPYDGRGTSRPFGIGYDPRDRRIRLSGIGALSVTPFHVHQAPIPFYKHMTYVPSTHELWASSAILTNYDAIQIIDETGATTLMDVIPSSELLLINDMLYVPSTEHVYVIDKYYARILQIDPVSRAIVAEAAIGTDGTHWPAQMVYEAHSNRVMVLRYVSSGSSYLWASNGGIFPTYYSGCSVVAIDPATLAITHSSAMIPTPHYQHLVVSPTHKALYLATGPDLYASRPNESGIARLDPATLAIEHTLNTAALGYRTHHLSWHQTAQRMYALDATTIDALHIVALDGLTADPERSITVPLPNMPGDVTLHTPVNGTLHTLVNRTGLLTDYRAGLQYDLGRATLED